MSRLEDLARQHGTDKYEHGYCPYYEELLYPWYAPLWLLEIGVMQGGSLRMWRDYYPLAHVFGIDHDPDSMISEDRIRTFCGAQQDTAFLDNVLAVVGSLNVIIDDGSHHPAHHLASFRHLWPHVVAGGWYVIEDCHSLYDVCWTQPGEPTIVDLIREKAQDILVGGDAIQEVHLIGGNWNDGMVFFRKRYRDYTQRDGVQRKVAG